jgi:hypothetical protein
MSEHHPRRRIAVLSPAPTADRFDEWKTVDHE